MYITQPDSIMLYDTKFSLFFIYSRNEANEEKNTNTDKTVNAKKERKKERKCVQALGKKSQEVLFFYTSREEKKENRIISLM